MAANTAPIYSKAPDIQWVTAVTAANTDADLSGADTDEYLIFTADATNGGFVREVRIKALPQNNCAATVARIWINNGSTVGTASNSTLFTEIGIPATTASATNALPDFVATLNIPLPAGYKLYITMGTALGGSGAWNVTAIGGKY